MTDPIFGEISDEESRLIAYKFQARMYLVSHLEEIKDKYTESIYKELCIESSEIEPEYYNEHDLRIEVRRIASKAIIKDHILYSDECLILYNPKSKEPAVIKDAYTLTEYDIDAFEEQMLIAYKQKHKLEESGYGAVGEFGKFVSKKAASGIIKHNISKLGEKNLIRSDRLSVLAKHYDGGHKSRMRLERTVRGKVNQKKAWAELYAKKDGLTKMAIRNKRWGKVLKIVGGSAKLGKMLSPISITDAFTNVVVLGTADTPTLVEKERMGKLIPEVLANYCDKYNNYIWILKQQYFEQG